MASIDPQSLKSTLAHMNKDHQEDLGLYLRFVNGLSAEQLAAEGAPELVDMDLEAMRIRTATTGTVHVVALDPPMATWEERRTRLVSLSMDARKAYGIPMPEHGGAAAAAAAATAVVPFGAPSPKLLFAYGIMGVYFVQQALVYSGRDAAAAARWAGILDAVGVPRSAWLAGPDGFRRLARAMTWPIWAIHVSEAWWFQRTRLAPRGMRWNGKTARDWWLWMGQTLIVGVFSFERFGQLARAQKAERKH